MGFNPFRSHDRTTADMVMLVLAVAATLAVIAWAIFST